MALSPVVDMDLLKNLGFILDTILEMRGSTRGFSLNIVTWKKKLKPLEFFSKLYFEILTVLHQFCIISKRTSVLRNKD
jgi:hypothetical protein